MKKKKLYLYLVTPKEELGAWDVFRAFVVVADSKKAAAAHHPGYSVGDTLSNAECWKREAGGGGDWVESPDDVTAKCVGVASRGLKAGQIICSDYLEG